MKIEQGEANDFELQMRSCITSHICGTKNKSKRETKRRKKTEEEKEENSHQMCPGVDTACLFNVSYSFCFAALQLLWSGCNVEWFLLLQ